MQFFSFPGNFWLCSYKRTGTHLKRQQPWLTIDFGPGNNVLFYKRHHSSVTRTRCRVCWGIEVWRRSALKVIWVNDEVRVKGHLYGASWTPSGSTAGPAALLPGSNQSRGVQRSPSMAPGPGTISGHPCSKSACRPAGRCLLQHAWTLYCCGKVHHGPWLMLGWLPSITCSSSSALSGQSNIPELLSLTGFT